MTQPTRQAIVKRIEAICELSPDVRFGQLLANLAFLAEDLSDRSLWDIDDEELLRLVERHHADLCRREIDTVRRG